MANEIGFSFRHFATKHGVSDDGIKWIDVNLIFEVQPEYEIYIKHYCEQWIRSILYEVEDANQITDFYESQPREIFRTNKHPARRVGLTMNDDNFLIYLDKFNVYRFHEIVEDNPITRAILRELYEMHTDGDYQSDGRFITISRLTRCLRALNTFWD